MMNVSEIMNREIFALRQDERAADALHYLGALGITSAPVLDDDRRPVGIAEWSDLVAARNGDVVGDLMKRSLVTVGGNEHIRSAARILALAENHCVVVVDAGGHAVGVVSAIDVVRGLVGMPSSHPEGFAHVDPQTHLTWSDPKRLRSSAVDAVPAEAGILALLVDRVGSPAQPVWFEAAQDLRARLQQLAFGCGQFPASVAAWRGSGELDFRHAVEPDSEERDRVVELLWDTAERPAPGADSDPQTRGARQARVKVSRSAG